MAKVRKRTWINSKGQEKTAYVADYRDQSGTRHQPQFARKKVADAALLKAKNEINQGTHVARNRSLTFSDLVGDLKDLQPETFLADRERRNRIGDRQRGSTLDMLRRTLKNHLLPFFGPMKLTDIDKPTAQKWMDQKAEQREPGPANFTRFAL